MVLHRAIYTSTQNSLNSCGTSSQERPVLPSVLSICDLSGAFPLWI